MEDERPNEAKVFRSLSEIEKEYVLVVLDALHGNKMQAAKAIGISRHRLYAILNR